MKVRLEDNYKKYYTLEELEQAKKVIKYEKENDEETVMGWAEYAAKEVFNGIDGDYLDEVIVAKAETCKNNRAFNAYGDDTGHMDVWITGIAKSYDRFIEFGAYLSDIWQTGAIYYKDKMYIRKFVAED